MRLSAAKTCPRPLDDIALMARVAQGDPEARRETATRLCERVRRVQRALLLDAQDADDAAQETLIEILRSASSYRGDASLERWADRIAVRTGLRHRRRERRYLRSEVEPDELAGTKPHDGEVDALPRPLLDYLRGLPDRDRQVLFLRHGLGYSMQEVAEMMESPLSTTKYRLGVALQRVRKAIRRDTICGRKGADDA